MREQLFRPNRLCFDFGALSGGVGSAVSGIASAIGSAVASKRNLQAQRETNAANVQMQRETNAQNLQINQMNNDFNANEAQKQRDYQTSMWEREAEYNSASMQRQRLEDAGLNPYLMLNGGNAGAASSGYSGAATASSSGNAQMIAPRVQAPQLNVGALQQAFNQMMQPVGNWLSSIGTFENQKAQSEFYTGQTDWSNTTNEAKDFQRAMSLQQSMIKMDSRAQALRNMYYAGAVQQAQFASTMADVRTKNILNTYLPAQQQADLWLKASQIANTDKDTELKGAMIHTEVEKALMFRASAFESQERWNYQKKINKIVDQVSDGIIESINAINEMERDKARNMIPRIPELVDVYTKSKWRNYRMGPVFATGALAGGAADLISSIYGLTNPTRFIKSMSESRSENRSYNTNYSEGYFHNYHYNP